MSKTIGSPERPAGSVSRARSYARAHGGGTVATSSQNGTSTQVIAGADVAAIGGFSGNESQVSAQWLADAVKAGNIRYVLTGGSDGGGGGFSDGRTGSRDVMAAVEQTCAKVSGADGSFDAREAQVLRILREVWQLAPEDVERMLVLSTRA